MILIHPSSGIGLLQNTVEECCPKMLIAVEECCPKMLKSVTFNVGHRDSIIIQSVCGSHIPRFQCTVVQKCSNSIALHCDAFLHVNIPVTC